MQQRCWEGNEKSEVRGAGQNFLSGGTKTLIFRRHADTPSKEPGRGCSGEAGRVLGDPRQSEVLTL